MLRFCVVRDCALWLLVFGVTSQQMVDAADPRVTRLLPIGGQVGQTLDVTFSGDRLNDVEEVLCNESGLVFTEVVAPEDKSGKQVTAKLTISADAEMGVHRLRLRTRTGISEIVTFAVGPYPVLEEKEPNSEFTTPQPVAINHTVQGRIENEDVDYFTVEAKKGDRLSVEVEALRLGMTANQNFFDPYLAVLDQNRFELAVVDDHALTRQDAFVSLMVPEDGTYTIQLRDASYRGGGNSYYRLHVGHFARPTGVLPAGGQPGETITVKMLGDPAGDFEQQVTLPADGTTEFGMRAEQNGLVTPTTNALWVSPLPNVIEVEPNEKLDQATELSIPGAGNGYLETGEDLDYFKVTLKKDQQIDVDVVARRVRSSIDSVVDIYNSNGGRVAGDDDRKRPDSWVRYKAPADGDYYIKVRDQLGNGGPGYFYRIEVVFTEPAMKITVNDISRYVQPDVIVPQGRRRAVLATVTRENFGGEVLISGADLPAGVTVESPVGWAKSGTIPLLFTSTPESPLSGGFGNVIGTWKNPNNESQVVSASVEQHYLRVRVQNNRTLWQESFNRVPIVVTEQTPFDIQVVPPKVPLVRGGTMNLKVVATRAEGFDEPISVLMLQNAPGVNSSRSVKIQKGETEALVPLNASGNAAIQETFMTMRALARVGNGTIEIASPFFPLTVAEKYMNLKYVNMAVDQGESVDFPVDVEVLTEFAGEAKIELIGLPAKTSTEPQVITKDSKQVVFPIKTEPDAAVGETKNLFCRITVMQDGEPVVHQIGSGRLRITKPAPVITKPKPEAKPVAKTEAKPKVKVLSRLEKLRLQQEQLRSAMNP